MGMFAADGCVKPNIHTKPYAIAFGPKCEHTKVRGAIIVIEAPSQDDALIFAEKWLMTGPLRGQTVITGIREVPEGEMTSPLASIEA